MITSEKIETAEEIKRIIDLYRRRWPVEEFFKGLKTGCKIEEKQFQDLESWKKLIALYLPVTGQLLNLRLIDKVCLNSLKISFSKEEKEILKKVKNIKLETTKDLLYAIASLGGHIKYNGQPGWIVLFRGMKKLKTLEAGWKLRDD